VRQEDAGQAAAPSLTPPKQVLDDDWNKWLMGDWESSAESDLGPFINWVKGRGHMHVEPAVGGQFLMIKMTGQTTELSQEYVQHLRQTQHTAEQDIDRLRNLPFESLEIRTIHPETGEIAACLFDSWRCMATGTGTRTGGREVITWEWSVAGRGTSVRTTNRVGGDRLNITERYTLPDGVVMEDRVQMTRVK